MSDEIFNIDWGDDIEEQTQHGAYGVYYIDENGYLHAEALGHLDV